MLYLIRELQIGAKLSVGKTQESVVNLKDAFVNDEAIEDHTKLDTIYLVFELINFDLKFILSSAT